MDRREFVQAYIMGRVLQCSGKTREWMEKQLGAAMINANAMYDTIEANELVVADRDKAPKHPNASSYYNAITGDDHG